MTTRREFIKNVAIGTAAVSVGGVLPSSSAKSYNNIVGANDRIRMAAIGVNSRGNVLATGFAKETGCEVSHICDVDNRAMAKTISNVEKTVEKNGKIWKKVEKSSYFCITLKTELK